MLPTYFGCRAPTISRTSADEVLVVGEKCLGVCPRCPDSPEPRGLDVQLDVEVAHVQRVLFDELATWLDLIAHQHTEQLIGPHRVAHFDLQQ